MTRSHVLNFLIKFAGRPASAAAQRQYAEDNPSTYNNRGSSNYQQDRARELAAGGMTGTQANDRARYDARQMDAHYRNAPKVDPSTLVNRSGAKIKGIAAPQADAAGRITGRIKRATGKPMADLYSPPMRQGGGQVLPGLQQGRTTRERTMAERGRACSSA